MSNDDTYISKETAQKIYQVFAIQLKNSVNNLSKHLNIIDTLSKMFCTITKFVIKLERIEKSKKNAHDHTTIGNV